MADKKQIKNENDFLGCLIAYSDENDNCDINVIFKNCDIENLNASYYLTLPTAKAGGFTTHWIKHTDFCNIHILSSGKSAYQNNFKKTRKLFFDFSKNSFKHCIEILISIISGTIVAYLIWYFGWN